MPDMIFPTTEQKDGLGTKLNTINFDSLEQRLAEAIQAGDKSRMPKELLDHFKSLKGGSEDDDKEETTEDKGGDDDKKEEVPSDDFIKKALAEMDQTIAGAHCACGEAGCPDCARRMHAHATASTHNGKIVFTDPSQLSAEHLLAQRQAGNEAYYQAGVAARKQLRARFASTLRSAFEDKMTREAETNERAAFRKSVIAKVREVKPTRIASAPAAAKQADAPKSAFVSSKRLSEADRAAFAQRFAAHGFPQEYINAVLGSAEVLSDDEQAIREIMASALPDNAKRVALASVVRTAKLSEESRARAIRFWKEDLGYGDQKWVDDLFSAKYE